MLYYIVYIFEMAGEVSREAFPVRYQGRSNMMQGGNSGLTSAIIQYVVSLHLRIWERCLPVVSDFRTVTDPGFPRFFSLPRVESYQSSTGWDEGLL